MRRSKREPHRPSSSLYRGNPSRLERARKRSSRRSRRR
nr:MAG TPA: hypothetical protein [Caudoviricetes sp.]